MLAWLVLFTSLMSKRLGWLWVSWLSHHSSKKGEGESLPCYSVNTVSLDFQAGDLTLLKKAAASLGLELRALGDRRELVDRSGNLIATLEKNKATCSPVNVATVNKLRVQYSKEIVNHVALKLGWQKSVKTENKFVLRKGC